MDDTTQWIDRANLSSEVASETPATPVAADTTYGVEKFPVADLMTLRSDMLQSGVDSFQAAEIVTSFLSGRGYGVSNDEARIVAAAIEQIGCPVEHIQKELEKVARIA